MPFRDGFSVVPSFYVKFGSGGSRLKKVVAGPLWSFTRVTGHGKSSPL